MTDKPMTKPAQIPQKGTWRREMEAITAELERAGRTGNNAPTLLLHSCCGPCSSAVIETLSRSFRVTVYYFNPNIDERLEYEKRASEQKRLLDEMETPIPVAFLEGEYDPEDFLKFARLRESDREGGERCTACYALRIDRTAREAAEKRFEWFTTTLSVSPMKDAERLNRIGLAAAEKYHVRWLPSDFKKKNGYQRSIELSREYDLYRQDYCGCSYSRIAEEKRRDER